MASDITALLLTNDRLPEAWRKFHAEKLLEAIGDSPLIVMSRVPSTLPGLNIIQDCPPSKSNIFYQMLRGIREVKTKYVAIIEDDCVYYKDHFLLRPKDNEIAFNQHRWSLYVWNPIYSLKNYIKTNATMIAPTKLALELLERRFAKYPMGSKMPIEMCGELGVFEEKLGFPKVRVVELKSEVAVVQLDTDFFTVHDASKESIERRHKKTLGKIKATSIPEWGDATNLTKYFN